MLLIGNGQLISTFSECTQLKGQNFVIEVIILRQEPENNFIGQIMPFFTYNSQYIRAVWQICNQCIQVDNKNNTRSNFQTYKEGLEEHGIKIKGIKITNNEFNSWRCIYKGRQTHH